MKNAVVRITNWTTQTVDFAPPVMPPGYYRNNIPNKQAVINKPFTCALLSIKSDA